LTTAIKRFLNGQPKTFIEVRAKATYFRDQTRVYIPVQPYSKKISGTELTDKQWLNLQARSARGTSVNYQQNLERSLRNTKKVIQGIVLMNDFDLFVTITLNDDTVDRYNIDLAKKFVSQWHKNKKKKYPNFEYLIIPEFHKKCKDCVQNKIPNCTHTDRPKAIHFHALYKGYTGFLTPAINNNQYSRYYKQNLIRKGRQVFNLQEFKKYGYTDVEKIEEKAAVASYIRKYITKDMPTTLNKKRYWASRGLDLPQIEENPQWFLESTTDPKSTADSWRETKYGLNLTYPARPSSP